MKKRPDAKRRRKTVEAIMKTKRRRRPRKPVHAACVEDVRAKWRLKSSPDPKAGIRNF